MAMPKAYEVVAIHSVGGQKVAVPLEAFADDDGKGEERAKASAAEYKNAQEQLNDTWLCKLTPSGPVKVAPFANVLLGLGLHGTQYGIRTIELHAAKLTLIAGPDNVVPIKQ